jgi:hypothetical protein
MPEVRADILDQLIASFAAHPQAAAVVPTHEGARGNPALLGRALFEKATIADKNASKADENYYAYRVEKKVGAKPEDKYGVPYDLQGAKPDNYPGTFVTETDKAGNTIRYVIERMCLDEGEATVANCDMSPPKQSNATTAMELNKVTLDRVPFYRLTVRVDGPNNTTTYAQAMLR